MSDDDEASPAIPANGKLMPAVKCPTCNTSFEYAAAYHKHVKGCKTKQPPSSSRISEVQSGTIVHNAKPTALQRQSKEGLKPAEHNDVAATRKRKNSSMLTNDGDESPRIKRGSRIAEQKAKRPSCMLSLAQAYHAKVFRSSATRKITKLSTASSYERIVSPLPTKQYRSPSSPIKTHASDTDRETTAQLDISSSINPYCRELFRNVTVCEDTLDDSEEYYSFLDDVESDECSAAAVAAVNLTPSLAASFTKFREQSPGFYDSKSIAETSPVLRTEWSFSMADDSRSLAAAVITTSPAGADKHKDKFTDATQNN